MFKLVVVVLVVDRATRGLVVKRNLTLDPGPLSASIDFQNHECSPKEGFFGYRAVYRGRK